MLRFAILMLFFALPATAFSQIQTDSIYMPTIHTVQAHVAGWELSYPLIRLHSDDKLNISFDELLPDSKNYSYTLVHCNSDWEPEPLHFNEVAEGFEVNPISDIQFSTNTVVNYVHYRFEIPDKNWRPLISGNYIVKVFAESDENKLVFTKRVFVIEPAATIDFTVARPELPKYFKRMQQFKLKVTPNVTDYTDLKSEIKTIVVQNFNAATSRICYNTYIKNNNSLLYDDIDSNLFFGGNEYRNFDTKSLKYQSSRIKEIRMAGSFYQIVLHDDEWRDRKQYFSETDINGKYYVENNLGVNKNRDADYFAIDFNLPCREPIVDGDLYVFGDMSLRQCAESFKMQYNFERHAYQLTALLKQGYYNYQIVYQPHGSNVVDFGYTEGNHYETENEYMVFVYYKSVTSRYERLIGYTTTSTYKQ